MRLLIADDEFAAVSIPRRMLPAKSTLLFGDRARRFAWPARGTERFLGRNVSHSLWGRGDWAVVAWEHARAWSRIAVWCRLGFCRWVDTVAEPSRRRHRRLPSVRNKTEANDYDVQKLQNGRPWKERTYILRGQI